METVLYSIGDSVTWGAELENKEQQRYSYLVSKQKGWIDCNNASAGVSNDYMYRHTIRDVSHWIKHKEVWSEETGWVKSDKLCVIVGWTAPTRFEWWEDGKFVQERLWAPYDKWGEVDSDKMTDAMFVLNQTQDRPSYIRTFNHIISLSSFLSQYKIPHFFFNTFYDYSIPSEPFNKIDKFGKETYQTDLECLWGFIPDTLKEVSMYEYLNSVNGKLLKRMHPSAESHRLWAEYLIENGKIDEKK